MIGCEKPWVTLLATHYKRLECVFELVNTFWEYNEYPYVKFLVIDDCSGEDIQDTLKKKLSVDCLVLNDKNIGQGQSICNGLRSIDTPYVMLLDDDMYFVVHCK